MRNRLVATALVSLLALSACSDDNVSPNKPAERTQKPPAGGFWLAVLRVEDDPNALDSDTHRLRKPAGKALVIAQVNCYDGLAKALDIDDDDSGDADDTSPGTYILGLKGDSRPSLKKLAQKIDYEPIVITGVVDRCQG